MAEILDDEEENIIDMKKKVRVLPVGIGQGGSKLAKAIGLAFGCESKCVYMNTSDTDIEGIKLDGGNVTRVISVCAHAGDYKTDVNGNPILDIDGKPIPLENIDGSGKNRGTSFSYFKLHNKEYIDRVKVFAYEEPYDIIFVSFSTAGGTGSGIGPKLTGILSSVSILDDIEKHTGKRPIVIGLPALPELSPTEGNISYENTLEALEEIDKLVNPVDPVTKAPKLSSLARFVLINNSYGKSKETKRSDQLTNLNVAVAEYFKRYLLQYGTSRVSTLDCSDRMGALKTMGLHSFIGFNGDGNRIESPFFVPDGERVKRCCYEIPENAETTCNTIIANTGAICDDTIHGFFDTTEKFSPIIAFHGFRNVSKIAEQFDKRLKLNIENQKRIEKDNIYAATGLNNVATERARKAEEYGEHGATDADDILSL